MYYSSHGNIKAFKPCYCVEQFDILSSIRVCSTVFSDCIVVVAPIFDIVACYWTFFYQQIT